LTYPHNHGITTEGGRIVLDLDQVHRDHDVNDGDDNCRTCAVPYPCELVEAVDHLADLIRAQGKTPAPSGAGQKRE
jgi:hypothetical protein